MRYLFIIGKSGCGKTTLAEKIEGLRPKHFNRVVQYTTREMRDSETDGVEYFFITKNEFKIRSSQGEFFAEVKKQFPPSYYGTPYGALDKKRCNIVIASIEGLLDSLAKLTSYSGVTVLNISEVKEPEATRDDGRNTMLEEKYNDIVLEKLKEIKAFKKINFVDISYEDLKFIRNDDKKFLKFMKQNKIK